MGRGYAPAPHQKSPHARGLTYPISIFSWGRDLASGLAALAPLIVTLYILAFSYSEITSILYVATVLSTDGTVTSLSEVLGFTISIIILLLLVFSVDYPMRTAVGRLLEPGLDTAMSKVPPVRIVYNASKLAVETVFIGTEDLQKPIRLETWSGICMTAFKTGKTTKDGKVIVFMPTAPNTITGFVMEADPEDTEGTGEKVEEALTCTLSAGFAEQDHVDGLNIEVTEESGDGRVPNNE